MKSLKLHRCFILGIELLQPLYARTGIALWFAVWMQRGYLAAISLLEFLQAAVGAHSQLPVQVEKIDLVNHAFSPVAWWFRTRLTTGATAAAPALASRRTGGIASTFCT